ncbi:peptidylprolyl isomerase [Mesorhizobium australicum]|uniref:Periplasmic chaperone for outer membrane proteins SurA n=1 Tax=Mesorhizobium australicum TaxID=536018 RepID=A0A1X7P279_9HYPH|nr:peptidylprolyl isomerase [Mesorhizobium australicum]SMH44018.1 periplasmic chaperone for outer membrane proteins SurA [Mesorhizobium australicum]
MNPAMKRARFATVAVVLAALSGAAVFSAPPAVASEIKYIVNNTAVTSYDIQRRVALNKLFRQKGGTEKAAQDMVEQALKSEEMARRNIRISKQAVDDSYNRFATSNKLKPAQLDQILSQAGIGREHMKEFIRIQMGWSQLLGSRYRSTEMMTEQQMVRKVFELGGKKPSATEYMLQKITFVVPQKERGAILGKRKREADAMRQRFNGCETTRQFAKGLIDVSVQDIPRILEPELPPDWATQIKAAKPGTATAVRETPAGVEFIGVCSSREVNDDRAAQMMLQTEGKLDEKAEELSKKYVDELRKTARIVQR